MMLSDFQYAVAIRTLGKAGKKYQQELDSLKAQTIPPTQILVYLAEGYERPKETIGIEQIIYCAKGMVSQRALSYHEVQTPYLLLLDDDVYLPPYAVEKLATALLKGQADCIAPDTFPNAQLSVTAKIKAFLTGWTLPMYSKQWAIRLCRMGNFFYNNHPTHEVYLTQSAAGPCSLWCIQALRNIRFEEERWYDALGFAYGDERLFFYKLYVNGGKLLFHYNTGVLHLDSQSSRTDYLTDPARLAKRARALLILWWRTDFSRADYGVLQKCFSLFCYLCFFLYSLVLHLVLSLVQRSCRPVVQYVKGNLEGVRFTQSREAKGLNNYRLKEDVHVAPLQAHK